MSNSQFCIQQRQQEQQRLKKFLVFGFVSSAALHGILAYALPRWSFEPPNQAKEPMELIIVDKPKPKPKPYAKRYPLGKPKVESKPIVEPKPKPVKPPEPVKAQTPPPPVEPPKPVQTQTPPPKPVPKPAPTPEPKEVLTTPTPAPSQPIVSAPIANTAQPSSLSNNFAAPSSSSVTAPETSSSQGVPGETGSVVAANSAPPRPESNNEPSEGISCQRNCEPEYPATLEGVEGSAGVKLTIDKDGNVVGAELASADGNNSVNRQALLAARQMQFSSPGDEAASVLVKIDFTVEGSKYDRARREEQERNEQAAKERQEQEAAARQQQLEAEKQAQQEQLEQERQARQQQLEQQQQESSPPPAPQAKPDPKPLPALSPEELDEERLRKFQERIENYQQE